MPATVFLLVFFVFPFFVVLAVATRSRGLRASLISGAAWAVIILPWTALLTRQAGRFTFGNVPAGTYTLRALRIGYAPSETSPKQLMH